MESFACEYISGKLVVGVCGRRDECPGDFFPDKITSNPCRGQADMKL